MDIKQIGAYFSSGSYEKHMICSYCDSIYVATEDNVYVLYKPYGSICFTSQCKVCKSYTDIESVPGIVRDRLLDREDGILLHINCDCKRGNKVGESSLSYVYNLFLTFDAIKIRCPICDRIHIDHDSYYSGYYSGYDRRRIKNHETCCIIL